MKSPTATLLRRVPLFSSLPDAHIEALAAKCATRRYQKQSVIITEGERSESLYVIEQGTVRIFVSSEEGKELVLGTLGPGEYFGELALLDDEPRSASVMTAEPAVLHVMFKQTFQEVLRERPEIGFELLRDLASRVRELTETAKGLGLDDVYARVVKTLEGMSVSRDGKRYLRERLTQQDLASRVGASREMVARILKDLTQGGYISIENRSIVINQKLPSTY
jgi:CRP/FNR family transcriptional regulator, cyclic AMP receptor protein